MWIVFLILLVFVFRYYINLTGENKTQQQRTEKRKKKEARKE